MAQAAFRPCLRVLRAGRPWPEPAILLYEHPLSSHAQKGKIALREKGVAFTPLLPEGFGTGRAGGAFAAATPRTEVPVLVDGRAAIFESIILDYIEERWPEAGQEAS